MPSRLLLAFGIALLIAAGLLIVVAALALAGLALALGAHFAGTSRALRGTTHSMPRG